MHADLPRTEKRENALFSKGGVAPSIFESLFSEVDGYALCAPPGHSATARIALNITRRYAGLTSTSSREKRSVRRGLTHGDVRFGEISSVNGPTIRVLKLLIRHWFGRGGGTRVPGAEEIRASSHVAARDGPRDDIAGRG